MKNYATRLLLLGLLALWGCAAPAPEPYHVVLGSGSYGYPSANMRILNVVQGDDFELRFSQVKYPECVSGSLDMVEFSGTISHQSLPQLNAMLNRINPCVRRDGRRVVNPVYLNSAQGELLLGIQLGQWFQSKGVEAIVTEGQVCESACALAYLGAQRKQVQANGRVVMHLSGEQGKGFDCARSVDMMPLRNYLIATAGKQSGQALFNQALSHCRNGQGWNLS
jgi:hypothetical protein